MHAAPKLGGAGIRRLAGLCQLQRLRENCWHCFSFQRYPHSAPITSLGCSTSAFGKALRPGDEALGLLQCRTVQLISISAPLIRDWFGLEETLKIFECERTWVYSFQCLVTQARPWQQELVVCVCSEGICSPFPRMPRSPCVHGLGVRGLTFGDSLPGPLMRSSQVILLAEQGNACGLPSQEKELCPSPGARHICGDSPGRVGTALNQLVPSLGLELCIPNPTTLLYPYLCWTCMLGLSVFPRDPKSD